MAILSLIVAILQLLATTGVGLSIAWMISKMTEAIKQNTRIAIEAVDMAATTRAKVESGNEYTREMHGKQFGYTHPLSTPDPQRRRQPSDSGFRPSARSPSNPDPDEIDPAPGRDSKRGYK